jgi:hypothetical protein
MQTLEKASVTTLEVLARPQQLRAKTKPSPQEFIDTYRAGLRRTKYTGCMIFTERYTEGVMRRYRIQEENPTLCQN